MQGAALTMSKAQIVRPRTANTVKVVHSNDEAGSLLPIARGKPTLTGRHDVSGSA